MRTVRGKWDWFTSMLRSALSIFVLAWSFYFLLPEAPSQGETTARSSPSERCKRAAVPGATVTVRIRRLDCVEREYR